MEIPPEETMPLPEETYLWYSLLNLEQHFFGVFSKRLNKEEDAGLILIICTHKNINFYSVYATFRCGIFVPDLHIPRVKPDSPLPVYI